MAVGDILHSGFISYCTYNNLKEWHTLTQANEVINFTDSNNTKFLLNSLLIESDAIPLYIRVLPSDYILYVPANESREYNFQGIKSIQVMNEINTKLRWSGQYF